MSFSPAVMFAGEIGDFASRLAKGIDHELLEVSNSSDLQRIIEKSWSEVIAQGWAAALISEELGGAGSDLSSFIPLVESFGRYALPLPLIGAGYVVPQLLREAGSQAAMACLQGVARGDISVLPVLDWTALTDEQAPQGLVLRQSQLEDAGSLTGEALGVEIGHGTSHFLVLARAPAGLTVLLLPAQIGGLSVTPRQRLDGRRSGDLFFRDVDITPEMILNDMPVDRDAVRRIQMTASLLACVEAVAAMGTLISETIEYLNNRRQFGTALSTFQVLRHDVADMYVAYQNVYALIRFVSARLLNEPEPANFPWREATLAKMRVGLVARSLAKRSIQLHGGMGMTEELRVSRLNKRLLMLEFEYGDQTEHLMRLTPGKAA